MENGTKFHGSNVIVLLNFKLHNWQTVHTTILDLMHFKLRKLENFQFSICLCSPAECAERLNRAPRWRQPAGRPLESTLPTSKPFSPLLALTPLRSRIGGPLIPPGQPNITCAQKAGPKSYADFVLFGASFSEVPASRPFSRKPGCRGNLHPPLASFRVRRPRTPDSTRQAPTKSSKSPQGRRENKK